MIWACACTSYRSSTRFWAKFGTFFSLLKNCPPSSTHRLLKFQILRRELLLSFPDLFFFTEKTGDSFISSISLQGIFIVPIIKRTVNTWIYDEPLKSNNQSPYEAKRARWLSCVMQWVTLNLLFGARRQLFIAGKPSTVSPCSLNLGWRVNSTSWGSQHKSSCQVC